MNNHTTRRSHLKFTPQQQIEICEYYLAKLPTGYYPSGDDVAAHFGCSGGYVFQLLKKHGYERRTSAETRDHRPCKPIKRIPPEGEVAPLCACGCGTPVNWQASQTKWQRYAPGHYRKNLPYHNAEWLRHEYIDKGRSVDEIAADFGVEGSTVIKSMKKHGIERRTTKESLILRGSVSGPNNPAWKGGIAKWSYAPEWKRLCKEIKDRDKWTCQLCGEQRKRWGHKLHVHHIDEDKTNNHPHNLISLCASCHAPVHGKEDMRLKLIGIATQNTYG